MDIFGKAEQFNKNVSLVRSETGPSRRFVSRTFLNGEVRNLPAHQVPSRDPYESMNLWRYPFTGQYTNCVQNGSTVQCRMQEGTGTGRTEKVYIRMVCQNNSSTNPCQYIPAPLWLKGWNFQNPNGEPIQFGDGTILWVNICTSHDNESWPFVSDLILSDGQYGIGDIIQPNEVVEIYIELVGNWLQVSGIENPWIKGDSFFNVTFQPDSVIRLNPATLTGQLQVNEMSLDIWQPITDASTMASRQRLIKNMTLSAIYPYYRHQSFSMALQPSSSYSVLLNGLNGDTNTVWILIRNSYVGTDLLNFIGLSSFQILNEGGNPITSQNVVTDVINRDIMFPQKFLGSFAYYHNFYHWCFSAQNTAPLAMIQLGLKLGAYSFTGGEQLIINTPPAGANEVIALQINAFPTQTGTGQTISNPQVLTGGFTINWHTPNGQISDTGFIPFDQSNEGVAAIIEAMDQFTGTVTVTGFPVTFPTNVTGGITSGGTITTWAPTTAVTFTFGGDYALQPLDALGWVMTFLPQACFVEVTNGSSTYMAPISVGPVINTAGQYGIQAGNTYNLDVYTVTSAIASISDRGYVKAQYS